MQAQGYKKISVQSLPPRSQRQTIFLNRQQLIDKMNWQFEWNDCPNMCYIDTGLGQHRVKSNAGLFRANSFFDSFYYAYTLHGDIVLVPDEIWIMIMFYLSTYIDENAQKLRKKIVKHQGVKTLTVVEIVGSQQQSLDAEKKWDYFFDQIIKQIEDNTLNGIVPALSCDFSTTNKAYKVISTAIVMSALKKYFEYHRMLAGCGINNVYMAGVREDWAKMIPKLNNLLQFDVDGKLKKYVSHMQVILKNFLDTFDEKPNVEWWNTVMKTPQSREIYGGQEMEVEGWILNFFGIYQKHTFMGFPEFTIKVPIKLVNTLTNQEKSLILVSDFVSVSKLNDRAYKPDVGLTIFHVRTGQNRLQKTIKQIEAYKEKNRKLLASKSNLKKLILDYLSFMNQKILQLSAKSKQGQFSEKQLSDYD